MAKRKRNSTAAAAAVDGEPDSPAPARKKRNTAAPSDAEALALLARARDALQAAGGTTVTQDAKLLQTVRALVTLTLGDGATVRLPRTAQADSDAVRLLREAVLAVRKCGVSDAVRGAVQEIQQLVEPQTAPKANGASKKSGLASASSSTAVSVVPPAAKVGPKAAKVVSGEAGTPPPEYTLEDDQDMPINALDPDTDYGWDYDEFTLLDHLSAFIDDDGSSSSDGASDFGGDYGPGGDGGGGWGDEDDPWSDDDYEEYYSD